MIKRILMLTLLLCISVVSTGAAATLEVQYEYAKVAQSFSLYMDNTKICDTTNQTTMICTDVEVPYGVHQFTLTAFVNNVESPHSPPYVWEYKEVLVAPTLKGFTITAEGDTVILKPLY